MQKASRQISTSSPVQALAAQARAFVVAGQSDAARAAYDELVLTLQRRASRIAYHYLRNPDDADEAVQDAFVKAYVNLPAYNDQLPFDAWFARILVNGCLDRLKRRRRQLRWVSPWDGSTGQARPDPPDRAPSPEQMALAKDWHRTLGEAIERLPDRQRTVVLLTHLDGCTPREVSAMTGLNENTVRVHLFRAVRRLRSWLVPVDADAPCEREA